MNRTPFQNEKDSPKAPEMKGAFVWRYGDEKTKDTALDEQVTVSEEYKSITTTKPMVAWIKLLIATTVPLVLFSLWGVYTERTTTMGFNESLIYNYACLAGTVNEKIGKITGSYEGARIAYKMGEEVYPGGYTTQRLAVIGDEEHDSGSITSQKGKASGHKQIDEDSMLEIVWTKFSPDDVEQVYCADYDRNGWYEAFVEKRVVKEENEREIWFITHKGETKLVDKGEDIVIETVIELPDCTLLSVVGRHGLDALYYVDAGAFKIVDMPDDEWWYSVFENNGTLWGTRVEYDDGKEYVDYELRYDWKAHKLAMVNNKSTTAIKTSSVVSSPTPTKRPTATPTQRPTSTPKPHWNHYPHWNLTDDYCTLQRGDTGDRVRQIQTKLIEYGYLSDEADGKYGAKTQQAVEDFQRNNGIFGSYGIATTMTQAVLFDEECTPAWVTKAGSYTNHGNQLEWNPDIAFPQVTLWMSTDSNVPITAFILGWYTEDKNGQRVYGNHWYWDWECYEVNKGGSVENYIPVAEMANPNSVYSFCVCVEEIYYADGTVFSDFGVPWEKKCYKYDSQGLESIIDPNKPGSAAVNDYSVDIELLNESGEELQFCWEPFYCYIKLNGKNQQPIRLGYKFVCESYITNTIEGSWDQPIPPGTLTLFSEAFSEMEGSEGSICCEIFIIHGDGRETLLGSKTVHCGV